VNVFRRTLLYAGLPYSARWYDVAGPGENAGARSLIYLRRREGVRTGAFRRLVTDELVPALLKTGVLSELRTQVFMPWIERLWNTPNVAHDNPADQRFHASLMLGFADTNALRAFFGSGELAALSGKLPELVSPVHAYEVTESLTYVRDGKSPPALFDVARYANSSRPASSCRLPNCVSVVGEANDCSQLPSRTASRS
jgi:hypothetical protein